MVLKSADKPLRFFQCLHLMQIRRRTRRAVAVVITARQTSDLTFILRFGFFSDGEPIIERIYFQGKSMVDYYHALSCVNSSLGGLYYIILACLLDVIDT